MSMYLPNSDLRPTGAEVAEFLDVPPMAESSSPADGPAERPDRSDGGAVRPGVECGA